MLSPSDLKNILALIGRSPIKGGEATTVALLQTKIAAEIEALEKPVKTEAVDDSTKPGAV